MSERIRGSYDDALYKSTYTDFTTRPFMSYRGNKICSDE